MDGIQIRLGMIRLGHNRENCVGRFTHFQQPDKSLLQGSRFAGSGRTDEKAGLSSVNGALLAWQQFHLSIVQANCLNVE